MIIIILNPINNYIHIKTKQSHLAFTERKNPFILDMDWNDSRENVL